ncbi:Tail fiber protein [Cedecea davisae]|uniref:Phage tail fibre protein N-terminal domain-containing protein n=1 Tax=Cedecea davisae DSM 4568 TaxID=566551 RepID=S3JNU7_9ENTR|nr:phage tail protein [Cedecea davisae]EPF14919.1 hypothetical protein HMPREF0201_03586 [Cedecea davisae DSM 4568]SUX38080.1 Tail fiber protein [Cedecea davisae]
MSQTVITTAFEALKAQQAAANTPVVLDEFVFANVPNLNITDPIDPAEAMPTTAQIVHRTAVSKTGVVNANGVVYSVTLGADVGDFDFNWVGLRDKTSNTLAMIVHAPVQQKVKNAAGTQGNVLTRSFLMEYDGAKKQTEITTPAGTWQIDFTARLAGMDERQRIENVDIYGLGAFIRDGFLVKRSGNNYSVSAGVGYVGGLRSELLADQALTVATKPVKVWVDVCWKGTLTSVWQVTTAFSVVDALADYVKDDVKHYVFAIAQINADGSVTDLRKNIAFLKQENNLSDVVNVAEARQNLELKSAALRDVGIASGAIPLSENVMLSTAVMNVPAGTDLNTINRTGFYDIAAADASGFTNYPTYPDGTPLYSYGCLLVFVDTLALTQIYLTHRGEMATRQRWVGGWGEWVTTYNTAHKPKPEEVGALPEKGNAVSATKLSQARKIAGHLFDGTADIVIAPADVGAVSIQGGDYNKTYKFGRVEIIPLESNMAALYGAQGAAGSIVSGAEFHWYGNQINLGIARDAGYGAAGFIVALNGRTIMSIDPSGNIAATGNVVATNGVFESGGQVRVYSSNNPPPRQDLSSYATSAWVSSYFVQGVRFGAVESAPIWRGTGYRDQVGYVITGVENDGNESVDTAYRRTLQININGSWMVVGA